MKTVEIYEMKKKAQRAMQKKILKKKAQKEKNCTKCKNKACMVVWQVAIGA